MEHLLPLPQYVLWEKKGVYFHMTEQEYKKGWFKMDEDSLASGLFLTTTGERGKEGLRREGLM